MAMPKRRNVVTSQTPVVSMTTPLISFCSIPPFISPKRMYVYKSLQWCLANVLWVFYLLVTSKLDLTGVELIEHEANFVVHFSFNSCVIKSKVTNLMNQIDFLQLGTYAIQTSYKSQFNKCPQDQAIKKTGAFSF